MSRSVLIWVVVLTVGGSVAFGQGQVVSYFVEGSGSLVVIPSVPTGGFVMTDFIVDGSSDSIYIIEEDSVTRLRICAGVSQALSGAAHAYSFGSSAESVEA